MLTLDDYFQGKDKDSAFKFEYGPFIHNNAEMLLHQVNQLLEEFGEYRVITSGWRPRLVNERIGGAPNSKHITANAVDLEDMDGKLKEWIRANMPSLIKYGLYMESPQFTEGWCHLQQVAPKSKSRIFIP